MATHLHFDCFSGVSGDMILGALVDAGLPVEALTRGLGGLALKGYELRTRRVMRGGLRATKVDVVVRRALPSPLSLSQIRRLIGDSGLSRDVKQRSQAVFERLGSAESVAHGVSINKVRFHEVAALDSLVDVIGGVLGCTLLGANRVTASAVNLGSGFVDSEHGRLPVPGPAVAALAKGIPVYSAGPERELTTPTGLALLGSLCEEFGGMPMLQPRAVGYGAGSADTRGWPNVLRVFVGDSAIIRGAVAEAGRPGTHLESTDRADVVIQIETNLDDLQPQAYETVIDRLFACGALDVTLTPVIMKRGRPGIILGVLASRGKAEAAANVILRETTALGVRMHEVSRRVLPRRFETVRIPAGELRVKVADVEPGKIKAAPEYSDCKRLSDQTGQPVREIMEEAMRALGRQGRRKKSRSK